MTILYLNLKNLGPFDDIEFNFDEKINVFTGPNNCGKSTVLAALGDIMVYPFIIPLKLLRNKSATYKIRSRPVSRRAVNEYSRELPIEISGKKIAHQVAAELKQLGYAVYIPALRRSTDYRSKGPGVGEKRTDEAHENERYGRFLTSVAINKKEELEVAPSDDPEELKKREKLFESDPSLITDKTVIQTIIDLDYKAYRESKPEVRKVIEKIVAVASEITEGYPMTFLGVGEDKGGLYPKLATPDGHVPLNILSQGTQSIIQWVAYLVIGYGEYYNYAKNLDAKPATLIIDEIDAHLHPSWQRRILPTLTRHFPKLQIFCSTHSPLMLAGLKAGQVQLLTRDKKGKVTVSTNETDIVSWSADEILRNFLDVRYPTDLGTEDGLRRLQALRRKAKLSKKEAQELGRLRRTVGQNMLSGPVTDAVERMADLLQQAMVEPSAEPDAKASQSAKKRPSHAKTKSTSESRKNPK